MRFRTKAAILIASMLLTFAGFNLIASTSMDIIRIGKQAGNEISANMLAKSKADTQPSFPSY